jgi:archaetidylinositol phosphate synthase
MSAPEHPTISAPAAQRPWDARLARRLVAPLKDSWVTPNHLTTVRLGVGLAAAAAFLPGTYGWSNVAALLLILSNFLDHTDGELARITGRSSRLGHLYDLASDAAVTVLLFIAIGVGVAARHEIASPVPPPVLGVVAGCAVALIFLLRMRIEDMVGKSATRQSSGVAGRFRDRRCAVPAASGHPQQCGRPLSDCGGAVRAFVRGLGRVRLPPRA